jgi:hypothetical protein
MSRFIALILICWLPLQGFAAGAAGHLHHGSDQVSASGLHASADGCTNSTTSTDENTDPDSHCAACHLSIVKFLVSTPALAFSSLSHTYHTPIINRLVSVDSAVPEPIPLA